MSDLNLFFAVLLLASLCKCAPLTWDDLAHNEDYIGKRVPCSAKEKLCFTYGRLLHEDSGKCYPVGEREPCIENSKFFVDKESVLRTGKFVGKCVEFYPWPEPWFEIDNNGSLVFLGKDCEPGHSYQQNIFGEYLCMCNYCALKDVEIFQTEENEGYCRVPNFFKYIERPLVVKKNTSWFLEYMDCPSKENLCANNAQIYWHGDDACHNVGVQDICEEGHLLLVDEQIFNNEENVVPVCLPRPCPEGQVLMEFDRKCHREEDMMNALCIDSPLVVNVFGQWGCGVAKVPIKRLISVEGGKCELHFDNSQPHLVNYISEQGCAITNYRECKRKPTIPIAPLPILK